MESIVVAGILVALVGMAVLYIWKEKKKGTRCIGCPAAGNCSGCRGGSENENCGCKSDKE